MEHADCRVFFLSDSHFFHDNIIKYCKRPFTDVDHMNSEMVRLWNEVVKREDIVMYVGDLSAGLGGRSIELGKIIRSLNGRKVLIRGNHDHHSDEWYVDNGFHRVVGSVNLGGVLLIHYPLESALARGIDPTTWGEIEHVVHGHSHDPTLPDHDNHFNVAADRNCYTPVSFERAMPERLRAGFLNHLLTFMA